ncbi:MAG: hypothetical protein FVQ83_16510 [Chloroflexi bacterium]|nr:hypothetical protein [Chloroflexota bacterium]
MSEEMQDEERVIEHKKKGSMFSSGSVVWGLTLILGGGLILLGNFNDQEIINLGNWWAIFPVVWGLQMVFDGLRGSTRRGRTSTGSVVWGLLLAGFGMSMLFEFGFEFILPGLLIVGGIVLLVGSFRN